MKIVIPPVLCALCMGLMALLNRLLPIAEVFPRSWRWAGILLLVTGVVMIAAVGLLLLRRRTEIHTFGRPRHLVTDGLFRFSRNPIYLGFTVSLVGAWVYLGSLTPLFGCLLFFLAANYWYIPFEEARLREAFGTAYTEYSARVGRWW